MFLSIVIFPSRYSFPTTGTLELRSVNGSSVLGNCLDIVIGVGMVTCQRPTTSVLFDGNIPTLTGPGLDGDSWARELLLLQRESDSRAEVSSDFSGTLGYTGVNEFEVAMFNCPEWGLVTQEVSLTITDDFGVPVAVQSESALPTSCSSLVRVRLCLQQRITSQVINVRFSLGSNSNFVHVAEFVFSASAGACLTDAPPASKQ
jgi:hypothetical protein